MVVHAAVVPAVLTAVGHVLAGEPSPSYGRHPLAGEQARERLPELPGHAAVDDEVDGAVDELQQQQEVVQVVGHPPDVAGPRLAPELGHQGEEAPRHDGDHAAQDHRHHHHGGPAVASQPPPVVPHPSSVAS